MANLVQLRMLENLDGILAVDKPAGIAFSTVVKTVKRKFNLVKVGHGGSLDTAAEGLLILLINDANRFVGEIMGADRAYQGVIRLGAATNTGDAHGEPTDLSGDSDQIDDVRLETALKEFRGDIFQTEPRFCSVRREGAALYEIADTGEHKPFLTHVYRFNIQREGNRLNFDLLGTKNLIVRALADDLGRALNCGAVLETCRRTTIGRFSVENAITFERLLKLEISDFASVVTPLSKAML